MLKFGSKSDVTVVHRATIRLLDDTEIIHCDFQPQHKGKYILEYVCKQLNILETDYFGLRYVDHCKQRHWLDLAKTVTKQVKDMDPILFSFRVKFYPPDPLRLKEEITRYQVYQQLKRDLLHGRLCCSPDEAALLAACIVQSELGDYDPEVHGEGNYVAEHKLLLKQTETIEEKAIELHQTRLKGCTPEQAETHFLRLASQLDSYAVDPHPVKDHKGTQLYLGFNHSGILAFHGVQVSRKISHFRWPEVQKINYEGKMFIVHLTINEDVRTKKKHTVGYKCPTGSNCRHVWRCAIEQMLFFTLPRASDAPVVSGGSIFSWGTKFRYTGRTEREVLEEMGPLRKEEPSAIQRVNSSGSGSGLRRKASSVPATPSTPSQDLLEIRYSSLPRSCHSAGLDGAGMSDAGIGLPLSSPYCPDNTLPLLETVSEDQEIHARRNNAVDEKDTHASATHTISVTNHAKKAKLPKSTLNRPQTLCSQRIVIGSDELLGHDIEKVVRERIDSLEKSPKVVRSTALIIKSSKVPSKPALPPPFTGRRDDLANGTVSSAGSVGNATADAADAADAQVSSPSRPDDLIILRNLDATKAPNGRLLGFTRNGRNHRHRAAGQHDREGNEYYFRDSFEHSSSESQLLVEASGKTHSRSTSQASNLQTVASTKICPRSQQKQRGLDSLRSRLLRRKSLRIIRIFVPALILTITILFVVIVLVFETDSTLLDSLRRSPEMMLLRDRYYVPIKEFLRTKLGLF